MYCTSSIESLVNAGVLLVIVIVPVLGQYRYTDAGSKRQTLQSKSDPYFDIQRRIGQKHDVDFASVKDRVVNVSHLASSTYSMEKRFHPTNGRLTFNTCRRRLAVLTISHTGCTPKRIIGPGCHGSCHSRSVPEWNYERQEVEMVDYCTCCEPREYVTRLVRLRCPGTMGLYKNMPVSLAASCACRPCSDGNPVAEQPYDY